jgi:hypothetical protein
MPAEEDGFAAGERDTSSPDAVIARSQMARTLGVFRNN